MVLWKCSKIQRFHCLTRISLRKIGSRDCSLPAECVRSDCEDAFKDSHLSALSTMARWAKIRFGFGFLLFLSAVSLGLFFAFLEMSMHRHIVLSQDLFGASKRLFSLTEPMTTLQAHVESTDKPQARKQRIVVIVAHGRSGSTFLASIFDQHPRVFYVFEPLHGTRKTQLKDYDKIATNLLYHIFKCDFSVGNSIRDIGTFFRFYSRALSSPPFCTFSRGDPRWQRKGCLTVTQENLELSCKVQHDTIVYKLLLERIPGQSIGKLFETCELAGVECKIIYLIRDIRPVVMSSQKVSFFKEKDRKEKSSMRQFVHSLCQMTETNLHLVRNLPLSLRSRVRLVRYEDLAVSPLDVLQSLYEYAGLEMLESIKKWIVNITHPSTKELRAEKRNPMSFIRNSLEILDKWRRLTDSCYVNVIERYCRDVMTSMGYIATEGSVEVLRNLTIPLFIENYPAKYWIEE
ncbi:carbohydrate sulfotransferase 5-like isoform X1 [Stylophora pistillata]|uniref:carbohydrate sulfotransferase 5-like isoform X1 n=2 Tax=Stylophora pistillata TaxID=50429 RepID=UPI000C047545|nr:carbohydrate sulfotransferase 5-like isoform X1 [Stylophora pistillata]